MSAITTTADAELVRVLDQYARELRELLEAFPARLDRGRMDELQRQCRRLLDAVPRPLRELRVDDAWARTHERLKALYQALGSRTSVSCGTRARVMACYDDLSRTYEQWLVSFRAWAASVGDAAVVKASSVKTLIKARTVFHMAMGLLCVSLYELVLTRTQAMIALGAVMAVVVGLEVSRRISRRWNHLLLESPVFHPIARPREYHAVNSSTYYLTALCVVTPLFSQPAVCIAVAILGFADPAAAWFGRRWGKTKLYGQKSLVGTTAFALCGLLVASALLLTFHADLSIGRRLAAAAAAALVGAVAELFSERLDDNLTVPIAASLAASLFI